VGRARKVSTSRGRFGFPLAAHQRLIVFMVRVKHAPSLKSWWPATTPQGSGAESELDEQAGRRHCQHTGGPEGSEPQQAARQTFQW
jgi:hypothetical protein